jgi:hypothetical protein
VPLFNAYRRVKGRYSSSKSSYVKLQVRKDR